MPPAQREVIRIPGYLRPDDFLDVFRFVEKARRRDKTFREFLKSLRLKEYPPIEDVRKNVLISVNTVVTCCPACNI